MLICDDLAREPDRGLPDSPQIPFPDFQISRFAKLWLRNRQWSVVEWSVVRPLLIRTKLLSETWPGQDFRWTAKLRNLGFAAQRNPVSRNLVTKKNHVDEIDY